MTRRERRTLAFLAAVTIVIALGGGSGSPDDSEYQKNRDRIEKMDPAEKRQLLKKQERFRKLEDTEQDKLRKLHQDLQGQENREELEQVMEAYFEWVCTLSASERSQLNQLSPQERVERVAKYLAGSRKPFGRHDRFKGGPGGPRGIFGARPPVLDDDFADFIRDYVDALKTWAGRYVVQYADSLAEKLPPSQAQEWKARLDADSPDGPDVDKTRWVHLVRWYLAGPKSDVTLDEKNVQELEALMSPGVKRWFDRFPPEARTSEIRAGLGRMIWHHFDSGEPEFEDLIPSDELERFSEGLPHDKQENLRRFSPDKRTNWLRFLYFTSKLPPDARNLRDDRGPFGEGRQPGRDGGGRRGPADFRNRGDGPGMGRGRPGIGPPPPPADGPANNRQKPAEGPASNRQKTTVP